MDAKLKPCPFCGGEAQLQEYVTESLFSHAQVEWKQVGCHDCGVSFESEQDGDDSATAAWNRRAEHERLADRVAKLEAENAALRGGCHALLSLCERGGVADNLVAMINPDAKNRSGGLVDSFAKEARRTMNEARALLTPAEGAEDGR